MIPDPVFDGAMVERVLATRWELPDGTWAWHVHQSDHTPILGGMGEQLWLVMQQRKGAT